MSLPDHYRKVINHYLLGNTKKDSCLKAGLSQASVQQVFSNPEVKEEIKRRIKLTESRTNIDREWLIAQLTSIITANEGELLEIDESGRPSLNFNNLSDSLRRLLNSFSISETSGGGKYKRSKRDFKYKGVSVETKLAAIKELAVLLGLREEKTKIDAEQSLIDALMQRRNELAGGG